MTSQGDTQLHREVGRIEGQVAGLDRRLSDMQTKVDEMHKLLMQAQGGWRVMVMVGSMSAVIGAGVTKIIAMVWPR